MAQTEIYEMLKNESLTTKEIADRLGIGSSSVNMSVKKLIKSGFVEKGKIQRKGKGTLYIYRRTKK